MKYGSCRKGPKITTGRSCCLEETRWNSKFCQAEGEERVSKGFILMSKELST